MDVVNSSFMPGDPRLIQQLVYELKSQGIFDQFRKECIADVDTKPAYQNLRQRVEGSVTSFLKQQTWRSDMNKNQVREQLRKNIYESGYLETGVERIVDQVVNPKINTVFLPQVEEVVYRYLGLEKPNRIEVKKELKIDVTDLLPTDLEAVSPESAHSDRKDDDSNLNASVTTDSKVEEDESPPFEPLEVEQTFVQHEENSVDSHLSGFSGLHSHDSNPCTNDTKMMELSNQDSQVSQNSSESHLSIITSEENSKMDVCEDSESSVAKHTDMESKMEISDVAPTNYEQNNIQETEEEIKSDEIEENIKDEKKTDLKKYEDRKPEKNNEDKKLEDKKNDKKHEKKGDDKKSRSSNKHSSKDKKDDKKDNKHRKSSSSNNKDKDKEKSSSKPNSASSSKDKDKVDKNIKDKKDIKSSSGSKGREKSDKEKEKHVRSDKEKPEKDKSKSSSSNSSRHSSSSSTRDKDKSSTTKKEFSSKDKDKEKSRSSSSSTSRDGKSKSSHSDVKSKSSADKHKKTDKPSHNDRPSSSSSSTKKDKDKKRESKRDSKDDHYSAKEKKNHRRSTDRDSNDGQSSRNSQTNSLPVTSSSHPQKNSQEMSDLNTGSGSGSGDSGNSDKIEKSPIIPTKLSETIENKEVIISCGDVQKLKYTKPKFASNFEEARKLMKIRKQLAKLEKQNQLSLANIAVPIEQLSVNGINCEQIETSDVTNIINSDREIKIERKEIINLKVDSCIEPKTPEKKGVKNSKTSNFVNKEFQENKGAIDAKVDNIKVPNISEKKEITNCRVENLKKKQKIPEKVEITNHNVENNMKKLKTPERKESSSYKLENSIKEPETPEGKAVIISPKVGTPTERKESSRYKIETSIKEPKTPEGKAIIISPKVGTPTERKESSRYKIENSIKEPKTPEGKAIIISPKVGTPTERKESSRNKIENSIKEPKTPEGKAIIISPKVGTPILQSTDLSKESWEALEARLAQEMSNVNYNSYESPYDDYDFAGYNSITISPRKKTVGERGRTTEGKSLEIAECAISNKINNETLKEIVVKIEKGGGNASKEKHVKFDVTASVEDTNKPTTEVKECIDKKENIQLKEESKPLTICNAQESENSKELEQIKKKKVNNASPDKRITKNLQIILRNEGIKNTPEVDDQCRYLEKPSSTLDSHLKCIYNFVDKLEQAIERLKKTPRNNVVPPRRGRKRKLEDNVDLKNNNKAHYEQTAETKKRRRSVAPNPNLVASNTNKEKTCNSTDVSPNDSFSLPLSPAESDKSNDKKEEESPKSSKQKRALMGKNTTSRCQRYSSDDLYKPRPMFASTRRSRSAKNPGS